jgi:signal transduction histidine kinase/ActR/RegA family two-component response regulator
VRDVTAEREAEEALRLHREELERLVEDRTAALIRAAEEQRRAEEAMRQGEQLAALGRLTGGVAHDFNNLLQVVTSGAALLRRELPEARRARVLDALSDAGLKARDLTSRLLAFARRQALRPEPFDLNRRVEGMTELLRRTLGSRVRIEAELAEELPPVLADPGQLEIAVINLATNARDAMPDGGRLTLRTRVERLEATEALAGGEYVCLDVEDTGEGMTPAVRARVFEPFFTTKEAGKGTGLGLAQVFGFARQSGGDVVVESAPGRGTRFTLHLPRAAALPAEEPPAPEPVLEAMRDASGRVVLVVEDNREAGDFAAALLEELGFRALRAGNVAEALAVLEGEARVDAVFSDVVMPGSQTGLDLALRLRAERPRIAVVLTSGYSARLAEGGAPEGMEVLGKPYRPDELAAALTRAFARVPEQA